MSEQSLNEIMYSVVQVEKEGAAFYRKLAAEVADPAVKNVFLGLAKDEVQHQKDFHDLVVEMKNEPLVLASATNLVEVLSNISDKLKYIMKGSELVDMEGANLKQALDIGIHNEKEAIRVYSELLVIRYAGFVTVLKRIIEEEKKHLSILEKMKISLLG